MSRSVDVCIYDYDELVQNLEKEGCDDKELLEKILSKFGHRFENKYVILCNEFYEEYNPKFELINLLGLAFKLEDCDALWDTKYQFGISSANAEEVAEELEILDAQEENW